jgi:hypothetical protein
MEMVNIASADYIRMSDKEMAAAHRARTVDECVAHLDRARRYALLACRERQWQSSWEMRRSRQR